MLGNRRVPSVEENVESLRRELENHIYTIEYGNLPEEVLLQHKQWAMEARAKIEQYEKMAPLA